MNPNSVYTTAIHEAAHAVAASRFKIRACPEVLHAGQSFTGSVFPNLAGVCHFDDGRITPFQRAVICWAGPLAHCLWGKEQPPFAPPYKPNRVLLADWHSAMVTQLAQLSEGDRLGILGYADNWRSCKSAFQIVTKQRARILRLARAMVTGRIAMPPAPMPDQFPATLADFLERIIADADPEARMRAFMSNQTEKFFAEKQFAFNTPEQRQQAMESWTAARMDHYRLGFTNAESWQSAAAAFRAWTKATAKNQSH